MNEKSCQQKAELKSDSAYYTQIDKQITCRLAKCNLNSFKRITNCPLLSSLLLFHRLSQILLGWATIVSNNGEKEVMSISE